MKDLLIFLAVFMAGVLWALAVFMVAFLWASADDAIMQAQLEAMELASGLIEKELPNFYKAKGGDV